MRGNNHALFGVALAVLSAGCWSTQPLTVADAPAESTGYGLEEHVQVIYMVIAAARTRYVSTGHAAYSPPAGPEALWRVYGNGGFRLEYCTGDDFGRCQDAAFPDKPGRVITLIDPANLGTARIVSRTTSSDYDVTTVSGQVQEAGVVTGYGTPQRGLWIRGQLSQKLYYCHVASGAPVCEAIGRFGNAIGVHVLNGTTDVLWVNRFGAIQRCAATAQNPTPVCELATVR